MKRKTYYALMCVLTLLSPCSHIFASDSDPIYDVQLVSFEDLSYPGIARVARIQGIVVAKASLDDKGAVVGTSAISGPKPLIPDCLANLKKWRFKPNAQKVAIVVYEFKLDEGACHDPSRSLFVLRHSNFATITACTPVIGG